jgi:DNA polymerase-1
MFTVDFSNQEGRVSAHLSEDKTFINQLMQGWDAHLATANAAFNLGIPEEALSERHQDYAGYAKKYKEERTKAKCINFALPYGGTEFAISKSMGVSKEEAKDAIDKYYEKYSGIKAAMDKAQDTIVEQGELQTMFGRKRHFVKVEDWNGEMNYPQGAFRQAYNFLIQSTSADMMRTALVDTRNLFIANPQWGAKIEMTVHDEGVFTVKEEFITIASEETKDVFENCMKLIVPIKASIGVGDDYEEAK